MDKLKLFLITSSVISHGSMKKFGYIVVAENGEEAEEIVKSAFPLSALHATVDSIAHREIGTPAKDFDRGILLSLNDDLSVVYQKSRAEEMVKYVIWQ